MSSKKFTISTWQRVELGYDLECVSSFLFAWTWAFTLFLDLEGAFAALAVLTLGILMRWFDLLVPPAHPPHLSLLFLPFSNHQVFTQWLSSRNNLLIVCISGWCFSAFSLKITFSIPHLCPSFMFPWSKIAGLQRGWPWDDLGLTWGYLGQMLSWLTLFTGW